MGGPGSGRRPKPVDVKLREGNPGGRPLPDAVQMQGRTPPDCPRGIPGNVRAVWDDLIPHMASIGMLDTIDAPMLLDLCVVVAAHRDAAAALAGEPPVVETAAGEMKINPALTAFLKLSDRLSKLAGHFGLDPASRARLGLVLQQRQSLQAEMAAQLAPPTFTPIDP